MRETHLIVFAKAPSPGFVKTRLAPVMGYAAAAHLAERLLNETLASVAAAAPHDIELCCAPDARDPALSAAAAKVGATLTTQNGTDLGERQLEAHDPPRGFGRRERAISQTQLDQEHQGQRR